MGSRSRYQQAPDGHPAREVGHWVERKVHHVDRYAQIFAGAMKKKWSALNYVELFAGPGMSWDKETRQFVTGSAVRALQEPFTNFVFVEMDPVASAALSARLAGEQRSWCVITDDCNSAIGRVADALQRGLTLAFVDPTNWQVALSTMEQLAAGRNVDILMSFFSGFMRRVWYTDVPALDRFFGDSSWRQIRDAPRSDRISLLIRLYNQKLARLGYLPDCWREAVPVRNNKNVFMYSLVLFSKNPLGLKFWRDAAVVDERGQRQLNLWDD